MTTIVLGSVWPEIARQLEKDLPDSSVREIDLGTRYRPPPDIAPVAEVLARANVIVPLRGVVDQRVLSCASSLRLIQQVGAGVDTVDLAEARRRRIPVCNVPSRIGGNADSVAELALFHLIGAGREFKRLSELVESGSFAAPFGNSLYGKTICIVGFGNIGQALARLLRPFRCRVIGIRRRPNRSVRKRPVEVWSQARLKEALSVADYVVVALPLSPLTEGFLGREEFASMKSGVRLVNISRGSTIDRESLQDALSDGRVTAAGLDVFWEEPVSTTDPILAQNVVATPHCGGLTDHMLSGTSQAAADNIRRVIGGKRPRFLVAPRLDTRATRVT